MPSLSSRTAYVLLAALEIDLRALVALHGGEQEPAELLSPALLERTQARRARDHLTTAPEDVSQLVEYLDFQDSFELLMRLRDSIPPDLHTGLKDMMSRVPRLVDARNRVAHNRPLEVEDRPSVVDFTSDVSQVPGAGWDELGKTRAEIRLDPAYVFRSASSLISDPVNAVANNLPSPDFDETSLLGRREERRRVERALRGSWPVVSILGDGGIGKTALALQVCFDLVNAADCPFDVVVWVTAKNAQLTSTEIVRIESAVQDSLGLFASAAAAVGGSGDSARAIAELLEVLGSFPTLLVLDNVETVLDDRFPELLAEIPTGSKVLITSRIGVKTENPFRLSSLSSDDAIRLLRILAQVRGVDALKTATDSELAGWAQQMGRHPAYIKWFVAGVQAGRAPERLLSDNGLILDFCMSDVFDFLGEDARAVLRSMLVIPGSHTLAELAFLNDFVATRAQAVVLELTSTNFVSQVRGGDTGTAYELSDFARAYLRRSMRVEGPERQRFDEKQRQLYALGGGMQAAHALDPFSPTTIDTRGVGDYSAARHLRDALDGAAAGRYDEALRLCAEAAELAPGYHEAARVEGYVHDSAANFGEAFESYSRARDLAPTNPYVAFAFGSFLLRSGFDPGGGLLELQRGAALAPTELSIQLAVCDAHLQLGDIRSAIDAGIYAVSQSLNARRGQNLAAFYLLRAYGTSVHESDKRKDWATMAEDVESLLAQMEATDPIAAYTETLDLVLLVESLAREGSTESADRFLSQRLAVDASRLTEYRRRSNADHLERRLGKVTNVFREKGFGFARAGDEVFFVHVSDFAERESFDYVSAGSWLVFNPGRAPKTGGHTPARDVYVVA
jgi:LuxR family glucitol operon transcriptional activator